MPHVCDEWDINCGKVKASREVNLQSGLSDSEQRNKNFLEPQSSSNISKGELLNLTRASDIKNKLCLSKQTVDSSSAWISIIVMYEWMQQHIDVHITGTTCEFKCFVSSTLHYIDYVSTSARNARTIVYHVDSRNSFVRRDKREIIINLNTLLTPQLPLEHFR